MEETGEAGRGADWVRDCHWYPLLGKVVGGDLLREDWHNRAAGWAGHRVGENQLQKPGKAAEVQDGV